MQGTISSSASHFDCNPAFSAYGPQSCLSAGEALPCIYTRVLSISGLLSHLEAYLPMLICHCYIMQMRSPGLLIKLLLCLLSNQHA